MNELDIKEKSTTIYNDSQNIKVDNQKDLVEAIEILQRVKKHSEKIIDYWRNPKKSAKNTYDEIRLKEKEMLNICDDIEKTLKNEILHYKVKQDKNATLLSNVTANNTAAFVAYNVTAGRFIYVSGATTTGTATTTLTKGLVWYLHLGYRKDSSGSTNDDQFIINKITLT